MNKFERMKAEKDGLDVLPGPPAGGARGLGDPRRRRPHAPEVVRALRPQRQGRPLHAAREGRPGRPERRPGRGHGLASPRTSAAGSSTAPRASASRSTGSRSTTSPRSSRRLDAVGLTTSGACGDITRNVVGCTLAGIAHDQVVDGHADGRGDPRALPRQQALLEPPAQVQDLGHRLPRGLRARPDQRRRALGRRSTTTAPRASTSASAAACRPRRASRAASTSSSRPRRARGRRARHGDLPRLRGEPRRRGRARLKFLVDAMGPEALPRRSSCAASAASCAAACPHAPDLRGHDHIGVTPQADGEHCAVGFCVPVGRLKAAQLLELVPPGPRVRHRRRGRG